MTILAIVAVCIVLLVLAFLLPRLSRHPQRGVDNVLGGGQGVAGAAPGKIGEWLSKPFSHSRKATNRSAQKGREGRSKLPG